MRFASGFLAILTAVFLWVFVAVVVQFLADAGGFDQPGFMVWLMISEAAFFLPALLVVHSSWFFPATIKLSASFFTEITAKVGTAPHLKAALHTSLRLVVPFVLGNYLDVLGVTKTSVSSHGIFSSSQSIWALLFSVAFTGGKFSVFAGVSAVSTLIGVFLVVFSDAQWSGSGTSDTTWGNIFCVISAILYAAYATYFDYRADRFESQTRRGGNSPASSPLLLRQGHLQAIGMVEGLTTDKARTHPPMMSSALVLGIIGAFTLVLGPGLLWVLDATGVESFMLPTLPTLGVLLGNGFVNIILGDLLYLYAVQHTSAFLVCTVSSLSIPLSMVATVLQSHRATGDWGAEAPHLGNPLYITGSLLVFLGVVSAAFHVRATSTKKALVAGPFFGKRAPHGSALV